MKKGIVYSCCMSYTRDVLIITKFAANLWFVKEVKEWENCYSDSTSVSSQEDAQSETIQEVY